MFKLPESYHIAVAVLLLILTATPVYSFPKTNIQQEGRAVWIHARMFSADKKEAESQLKEMVGKYSTIGINNLFCFNCMMGQHKKGWDFLEVLLKESHKKGINIHPVFSPGYRIRRLEGEIKQHPEWLIQGIDGKMYQRLNLAHPGAREYVLRKISQALKYDIDGIHLDYIRFPVNQRFSYDETTCELFKQEYGRSPREIDHDCFSMEWSEWIKWNARQVTSLVGQIKKLIKESGKNIPLSAAVFNSHENARVLIGQEWNKWAAMGIIDILCPMLYTNNNELFRKYVKEAVKAANGKCLTYPGIGVKSSQNVNTPAGVEAQVKISREEGADGVVFYSGDSLKDEFINKLKTGVLK